MCVFLNLAVLQGLLASRPTTKLEDHPLSSVYDCLFSLYAATLHIGGRSSIRNLRTRHAVVQRNTMLIQKAVGFTYPNVASKD